MNSKIIVSLILCGIIFIAGCLGGGSIDSTETEIQGTIRLGGSTTVYPIAVATAESFMEKHPKITIIVNQSSSGEGIGQFIKGDIDIADGTRPPNECEYTSAQLMGIDIQMTVVSNDAVSIIVHKDNPLKDISISQLNKIFFTGEISDWSEITYGIKNGTINIYGTDPEISGTAEIFKNKVNKNGVFIDNYQIKYPTPMIVPTIVNDPNGIAYSPLKWVDNSVTLLSVEGKLPSQQTVLDTSYKLSRKMYMMTDGSPTGIVRDYITYVLSIEGQQIVEDQGFIPIIGKRGD